MYINYGFLPPGWGNDPEAIKLPRGVETYRISVLRDHSLLLEQETEDGPGVAFNIDVEELFHLIAVAEVSHTPFPPFPGAVVRGGEWCDSVARS